VLRCLGAVARALPFETSAIRPLRYLQRFLVEADAGATRRYGRWVSVFDDADKRRLYAEGFCGRQARSALDLLDRWFAMEAPAAARAAYVDINTYLPDDLLTKVDVASMAHGLEGRSPFLDHELMEFAATIPASLKMRGLRTKALLRDAMAERLPAAVLRGRKMGFGVPIDRWFRADLREMAYDVLLSEQARSRGLFRPEAVKTLLDEHAAGRRRHHHRLWALLFLELWFRMWIDAAKVPATPQPESARSPG
jgi:asparagine synthase (glutamine-hydrolysing)